MKSLIILLAFLFSLSSFSFSEKPSSSCATSGDDSTSVDGIIKALYETISGPAGEKRNWDRLRSLFIPEARMIATGRKPDGMMVKKVMAVDDYIAQSGPFVENEGFFEKEIGRKTESFGAIVHLFSTYESRKRAEDIKPFMRGINSIQLWNDGKRWWIVTILWQNESKEAQIAPKYIGD